jgi:hypothetical protein
MDGQNRLRNCRAWGRDIGKNEQEEDRKQGSAHGGPKRRIAAQVNRRGHCAQSRRHAQFAICDYIRLMKIFLMVLLGIDMAAVVAVMLVGAVGMANLSRSPQTSNKLMRARVILQGIGIALVVCLMLTGR